MLKHIAKNTTYLFIAESLSKIIITAWIIFLTHTPFISVSQYGEFNFTNAYIGIFALFSDLGVGIIIINEIAKQKEKTKKIISASFYFYAITLIISITLLTLFSSFFSPTIKLYIFIAATTMAFSAFRSIGIFVFDGNEKFSSSALLSITNSVLYVLGGVGGVLISGNILGAFIGILIGTIFSTVITYISVYNHIGFIKPGWDGEEVMLFIKRGLPIGLAALCYVIYTKIDSVLLGNMLDQYSVGIYNAASLFPFTLIQLMSVPFTLTSFPYLTQIYSKERARFTTEVSKGVLITLAWSIPVSLLIAYLSPLLIPLLLSAKYVEAVPILQILVFIVPCIALWAYLYRILIIMNKQHIYLYISIIGAVINVCFNLYFIPQFHIYGAVISALITQVLLVVMYSISVVYFLKKRV